MAASSQTIAPSGPTGALLPKPGQFVNQRSIKLRDGQTIDEYLDQYHFKSPYDPDMRYATGIFNCDYETGYGKCEYEYLLLIINKKYFYVVALETRKSVTIPIILNNCKCSHCVKHVLLQIVTLRTPSDCHLSKYKFHRYISSNLQRDINNTKHYLTRERKYICYEQV